MNELESVGKGQDGVGNVLELSFELGTFWGEFLLTCTHSMPILLGPDKYYKIFLLTWLLTLLYSEFTAQFIRDYT